MAIFYGSSLFTLGVLTVMQRAKPSPHCLLSGVKEGGEAFWLRRLHPWHPEAAGVHGGRAEAVSLHSCPGGRDTLELSQALGSASGHSRLRAEDFRFELHCGAPRMSVEHLPLTQADALALQTPSLPSSGMGLLPPELICRDFCQLLVVMVVLCC